MRKRKIEIYDTTLRDGEQAPGNSMSIDMKLKYFEQISSIGVDYIEAGYPTSNRCDYEVCRIISYERERPTLVVFSRPTLQDILTSSECIVNKENVQLQLLLSVSDLHIEKKRKYSLDDAVFETIEGCKLAREYGFTDISLGLEDASRASKKNLKAIIEAGIEHGANTIVFADTVGCATPKSVDDSVRYIRSLVGNERKVSCHFHDDLGLATANALSAIEAGVDILQTTLLGIGERCGNTALEQISAITKYKSENIGAYIDINFNRLAEVCFELGEDLNIPLSPNRPIVGKNAFTTAAGIHINGILKDRSVYEYVHPEDFGRKLSFCFTKHSGYTLIKKILNDNDVLPSENQLKLIYEEAMKRCYKSSSIEPGDFMEIYNELFGRIQVDVEDYGLVCI
ncbi:LeuA family protein [Pseudoalteromonas sp. S16_S37]|uniref:LeuA family protein n=1 Tax=Pseudoalteromonas sp. S16_S37 TaxID=2720228 RepID=UPI001680CD18|nr:LeuA family protein [Pseudoalteromonas sp. S16_S37]MBD1583636.1 pyruvate carboxyltransferase [Pseudoalteromonas sp. S16_S37]